MFSKLANSSVWDPDLLAESRIKTTGSGFRSDPELRDSKISVHPKNFYNSGKCKKNVFK